MLSQEGKTSPAQGREKDPYVSPVVIDYGDVVAITRASIASQTIDGFGDPPDNDDPAFTSGG